MMMMMMLMMEFACFAFAGNISRELEIYSFPRQARELINGSTPEQKLDRDYLD